MRGNIVDFKVNIYKIEKLISKFKEERMVEPSYIIMNRETLDRLRTSSGCMSISSYETLYGLPIAISEVLKVGEADVV